MLAEILPMTIARALLVLFGLTVLTGILSAWSIAIARWSRGARLLPAITLPEVPWGTVAIMAVVPIWALTQTLAIFTYGLIRRAAGLARGGNGELSNFDKIALVGLINAALLLVIPAFLRRFGGARWSDLGLPGRPIGRNILRGIELCFLMLPPVYAVMALVTRIYPARQHPAALALEASTSPWSVALMFLSAVILAPAAEELCFRVVLLGWLTRLLNPSARTEPLADQELTDSNHQTKTAADPGTPTVDANPYSPPKAPNAATFDDHESTLATRLVPNLVTSLLFASLHFQQWPAPVALFVLSLGLGVLYRRTGSLIAPVAMHACFNGLSMTGVLLASLSGLVPAEKPLQPVQARVMNLQEILADTRTAPSSDFPLGKAGRDDYDPLIPFAVGRIDTFSWNRHDCVIDPGPPRNQGSIHPECAGVSVPFRPIKEGCRCGWPG